MDFPGYYYFFKSWHIVFGAIALVIGILPMVVKKGGKLHNVSGLIYVIAMAGVAATALPLAYRGSNYFLASIAVFSFYMCFTGYRFTKLKANKKGSVIDIGVSIFTAITSLGMYYIAIMAILQGVPAMILGLVLGVFGTICLLMSASDLKRYFLSKEDGKMDWFFSHLGRMIGSYIATFTAFAVQNSPIQPAIINWLGPTVIGTIAIVFTVRYYRKKFGE